jgi:hypothetical protein
MLTTKKNQVWVKLRRLFERVTDSLGKGIDSGIIDMVVALNAAGIRTNASCEGHLHRGKSYPWIDIECPQADALEAEILQCLDQDQRESAERSKKTRSLIQKHRDLLLEEERKLANLLDAFYRVHPMEYDRHLILFRLVKGQCRLQSHGSEYQGLRSSSERVAKLQEYQDEMRAFATFLKERF